MQTEQKRSRLVDPILAEIDQEAVTTKKLFDIIPEDKLDWRPHPKARSLGELAMHVAGLQGGVAELGDADEAPPPNFVDPVPADRAEILAVFAESISKAKKIIGATSDERALADWKLVRDGETLLSIPRIAFWRSILLNHNYHHRGQLSTYLRELDVPLPAIYGPSADERPFG
ncbi:MAG TPA: DinB family protein [Pyrinomonadaceae bacterium]|nr:DinB family protein [Pyrinomonadaceae bacterium]